MKLFLDIDETLVYSMRSCHWIPENVNAISSIIKSHHRKIELLETFTFGLYNESDRLMIDVISKRFSDLIIKKKLCVQDWQTRHLRREFIRATRGIDVNNKEVMKIFHYYANQERCFEYFCKTKHPGSTCILIDNTVPNRSITVQDGSFTTNIHFISSKNKESILTGWKNLKEKLKKG